MKILVTVVINILFLCNLVFGLNPQKNIKKYLHKNWQYEEGLPFNTIISITQTKDGYLWLGSKQGIIKFDGVKFTEFSEENYPELESGGIWVVYGDSKNNLWIGTDGNGLLKYKNGKFEKFTTDQGLADNVVWTIYEDSEGNIWIGTGGGGISKYRNGKFTNFTQENGLSSNYIWSLYKDKSGFLWAGTDGNGLNRIKDGNVTVFSTNNNFPSEYIFSITEDNSGNLYFGTTDGLIVKKGNSFQQYSTQHGLAYEAVWTLQKDKDDNVWIGTDGGGISKYYRGKFDSFTAKDGFQSNFITSIFQDTEGNIWVGTKGGGITRFKEGLVNTLSTTDMELGNDYVFCTYQDSKGNLWFGTYDGLTLKSGNTYKHFSIKDGLTSSLILTITEDKEGAIWIGTDGGGLNKYKNEKFSSYSTNNGLTNNSIWALTADKNNTLWIGTDGGGLNSFKNGKFASYDSSDGIHSEFISAIHEDKSGRLWVGSQDAGLFCMENDSVKSFSVSDGLLSNIVWDIYEDEHNNIWVGTNEGLCRIKKDKVYPYANQTGLLSKNIYSVIEDDEENLWMSCNKGILKVAKKVLDDYDNGLVKAISYSAFGIDDGMKTTECSYGNPSALKTNDGRLWFPTIKGVAFIDTKEIKVSKAAPLVHIERLVIDFKEYNISETIDATPGEGRIEIGYTAFNYSAPERILFKYKLDGYDEDWIDAGYLRTATYTKLPPGEYSFSVLAGFDGTIWDYNNPTKINFNIQPYYWQTWWFNALIIFLLILLIASYYVYRIYSIKKQNRILEELVRERTIKLEEEVKIRREKEEALKESEENLRQINISKDKLFSIISHDLRSPFQGILGFASILKEEANRLSAEEIKKMAMNIHGLTELFFQLLNNLLEWSRLQRGVLQYKPENIELTEMINRIVVLFYENANMKNITLRTELTHNLQVYADENMIASVIQNLISNAIKFTKSHGSVTISTVTKDDKTQLSVIDTGIGIEKELLDRLFKIGQHVTKEGTANEKGSGLGLILCKELIEKNGGNISVTSIVNKGSAFTIELPTSSKNDNSIHESNGVKVFNIKKASNG